MNRNYLLIIATFILVQFSPYIGVPLLFQMGITGGYESNLNMLSIYLGSIWIVISFAIGLVIILFLNWKAKRTNKIDLAEKMSVNHSVIWAVLGIFLAFLAQSIAISVEQLIGVEPGSENTEQIMQLIKTMPLVIIATTILGPIIEEIVFRKIIFGTLFNRFSFHVSAVISSVIFAFAHQDPVHLLLYTAMGITFSFLYVKTNRIIVPIVSHMAMNTIVVIVQMKFLNGEVAMMSPFLQFIGGIFK